jgi:hypothetical protein
MKWIQVGGDRLGCRPSILEGSEELSIYRIRREKTRVSRRPAGDGIPH